MRRRQPEFPCRLVGRMYACMIDRQQSYDLRHGTFQEGWDTFLPNVNGGEYSPEFECLGCELRLLCAQCPAMAQLEHGRSEKRVDNSCRLTHLRRMPLLRINNDY